MNNSLPCIISRSVEPHDWHSNLLLFTIKSFPHAGHLIFTALYQYLFQHFQRCTRYRFPERQSGKISVLSGSSDESDINIRDFDNPAFFASSSTIAARSSAILSSCMTYDHLNISLVSVFLTAYRVFVSPPMEVNILHGLSFLVVSLRLSPLNVPKVSP